MFSDLEAVKWIITGLTGIALWLVRNMIASNKEEIVSLRQELNVVKKEYLHKEDFKDFKLELRGMFEEIKRDIRELKKHETD